MRLFFILIILLNVLFGCKNNRANTESVTNKRVCIQKTIINYSKSDSVYTHYGYYKEILYKYNYEYKDSFLHCSRPIDIYHGIDTYINEYGDTVYQKFIDYTNYPRREE